MLGRMVKWSMKLSTYDIKYEPRFAIKSQEFVDFAADFSDDLITDVEIEAKKTSRRREHGRMDAIHRWRI